MYDYLNSSLNFAIKEPKSSQKQPQPQPNTHNNFGIHVP